MVRNISRGRPRRSSWKGASRRGNPRRTFRESQRPSLPRWYKCEGTNENRLSVEREKSRSGAAVQYAANLSTRTTYIRVTGTKRNPRRGDSCDRYSRRSEIRRRRRENPRSRNLLNAEKSESKSSVPRYSNFRSFISFFLRRFLSRHSRSDLQSNFFCELLSRLRPP